MAAHRPLRVAFIHPDLGIGGAERLVVDAALGLQELGHTVDIYTSHHDPQHCFEETINGMLQIHHLVPPLPRSLRGKFHILLAHARQLHLTAHLIYPWAPRYDVFFVDQLSTCIPLLRLIGRTRVVFYCHFPDKLLANGAFIEGNLVKKPMSLLRSAYRYPMDWLEEITTGQADIILANSKFTARVFKSFFKSISQTPRVVYPGINISAYNSKYDPSDPDIVAVTSERPTLLSLNRFEKKKNAALAIDSFAKLRSRIIDRPNIRNMRLVIAGGYDPRLEDNMLTLYSLIDLVKSHSLSYNLITPSPTSGQKQVKLPPLNITPINPQVLFLLNFTTSQRTALLTGPSTKALLYTPANEHFGIGPVEAMLCGVPVLACDSGGPTESVLDQQDGDTTGWLRTPNADIWANTLMEIVSMQDSERMALGIRAKERARALFGMEAMAKGLESSLLEAVSVGRYGYKLHIFGLSFLFALIIGCWINLR